MAKQFDETKFKSLADTRKHKRPALLCDQLNNNGIDVNMLIIFMYRDENIELAN